MYSTAPNAIDTLEKFIPNTILISRIMSYEGITAKNYFSVLADIVPQTFDFEKRSRRPPLDMFNSMLSFGYSLPRKRRESPLL
ncbi:MAG: CRISPR-associated endonuclease Cas1 [Selenomonadaceae bacterium]|nr:CRISPR-associated endonuclease Cas1 [Selenomonadaceae bacterium]